ncbi:MAG TPA: EAL domain-containing protein, partial [Acidimicrobiales bacterium]|nr:EAL domain-containing protein [Acidimicrobiales bacterium]
IIAGLAAPGREDLAVITTIAKLCQSLGICTVAEAVETADQVEMLRAIGIDVAQGYYFSPPLSAEDALALAGSTPPAFFPVTRHSSPKLHLWRDN